MEYVILKATELKYPPLGQESLSASIVAVKRGNSNGNGKDIRAWMDTEITTVEDFKGLTLFGMEQDM